MKKIFQTAVISLFVITTSCNDSGSNNTDDSTNTDTTTVINDNSSDNSTDNVMINNELPLNANQEVPANNSTASGTAEVTYNKDTKMLTYTLKWKGLTDKPTMAHIHGTAPRGTNAGVKHDLTNVLKKETSGSFTDSVRIGASDIVEDSLLSGFYYFNIHTPAHPAGEIRAQIEFQ